MINVYCIDDRGVKHEEYAELARELTDPERVTFHGLRDDRDWLRAADDSLAPDVVFRACTGPSDSPSFILLDIGGVHSDERFIRLTSWAEAAIEGDPQRSHQWRRLLGELKQVEEKEHDYAAEFLEHGVPFFICAAARIFGHKVVLFSSADGMAPDAAAFQHHFKLRSVYTGRDRAAALTRELQEVLKALHEPVDRRYLTLYLEHVRNATREGNMTVGLWAHDEFTSTQMRERCRELLGVTNRLGETDRAEEQALKALLELSLDQWPDVDRSEVFTFPGDDPISARALRDVVHAMGFPCRVEVRGADFDGDPPDYTMPMRPGFLFLLGLWQVVQMVDDLEEDGMRRSDCTLSFDILRGGPNSWGPVYRARLTLPDRAAVDHIYRYRQKTTGEADMSGWCRAIEDVAWGRVSLRELPSDLKETALAKRLEDGPLRSAARSPSARVASLSLGPGEISYYWA